MLGQHMRALLHALLSRRPRVRCLRGKREEGERRQERKGEERREKREVGREERGERRQETGDRRQERPEEKGDRQESAQRARAREYIACPTRKRGGGDQVSSSLLARVGTLKEES
jgi:hypothetical protein